MGRPLNKKYFGTGAGDHFVVLASVGGEVVSAEIVKQTGTKRFIVKADDETAVCYLVDKAEADLEAGEMLIQAADADGETQNVKVLKGKTAVLADNSRVTWSFGAAAAGKVQVVDAEVDAPVVPVITIGTQPADASVVEGATATFTVAATVAPTATLTYQWQSRASSAGTFANVSGATSASYTTPATVLGDSGKEFRCVVSSAGASSVNSAEAELTVTAAA